MCCGTEEGSYLRLIDSLRLKDLLGPVTRVKKKKKERWAKPLLAAADPPARYRGTSLIRNSPPP